MPVTLSQIMAEYDTAVADNKARRRVNTAKSIKGQADLLREQKAQGGLTPEQETALNAEIDRLDPTE